MSRPRSAAKSLNQGLGRQEENPWGQGNLGSYSLGSDNAGFTTVNHVPNSIYYSASSLVEH